MEISSCNQVNYDLAIIPEIAVVFFMTQYTNSPSIKAQVQCMHWGTCIIFVWCSLYYNKHSDLFFLIKTFIQNTEKYLSYEKLIILFTSGYIHIKFDISCQDCHLPTDHRKILWDILRWVIISTVQISRRYEVGLPHQAIIFPFDVHIQHYHQGRPDIDLVHETLIKQTTAQCNIPTCKHNMSASLNQWTSPTRNF